MKAMAGTGGTSKLSKQISTHLKNWKALGSSPGNTKFKQVT